MVGSCIFKERWLWDESFRSWLEQHPRDNYKAVCKLCNNKDFSNEKMVVSTLVLHVNGKYHKSIIKDTNPLSSLYFNVKMNLNRLLSL